MEENKSNNQAQAESATSDVPKNNNQANHNQSQTTKDGTADTEPIKTFTEPTKDNKASEDEETKNNSKWQTWLTVTGIIILIIFMAFPSNKKQTEKIDGGIETGDQTQTEETEDEKGTEINNEVNNQAITSPSGTSTVSMTPVSLGDFTYQFKGIDWEFSADQDKTLVAFKFEGFSRRSGNYVTFGRPFKLGSYAGTCRVVEQLNIDKVIEPDQGLSFVQCLKIDGSGTEIGLFQDSENLAQITAKIRTVNDQGKVSDFKELFSRDITTIVR